MHTWAYNTVIYVSECSHNIPDNVHMYVCMYACVRICDILHFLIIIIPGNMHMHDFLANLVGRRMSTYCKAVLTSILKSERGFNQWANYAMVVKVLILKEWRSQLNAQQINESSCFGGRERRPESVPHYSTSTYCCEYSSMRFVGLACHGNWVYVYLLSKPLPWWSSCCEKWLSEFTLFPFW